MVMLATCGTPYLNTSDVQNGNSGQGSWMRLPYAIRIASQSDVLTLERDVRAILKCHGNECAFLQCAEYKKIKYAMLTSSCTTTPQVLHIPRSTLMMHVTHDVVSIQNAREEVYIDAVDEHVVNKKRRRL
jgi:hypothetical protein